MLCLQQDSNQQLNIYIIQPINKKIKTCKIEYVKKSDTLCY
jgi:hypothetical protein